MSLSINPALLIDVEKLLNGDDMLRRGLQHSTPGMDEDYNLIEAHKWFNLAAMHGNMDARQYRQDLKLEMTTDEVFEAQRNARAWLDNSKEKLIADLLTRKID